MGAMQLDSKLLATFTTTFFGYGNLAADWWFVGMEEGGGHSDDEISARLAAWRELGATPTVDIVDFGRRAGIDEHLQWFEGDRPPLQSTWRQLIRMILGARGETRAPSPSVDKWHCATSARLPRRSYSSAAAAR